MSAREVCDKIQEKMPPMLARHRDPIASVTTVLHRLTSYGERKPCDQRTASLAVGRGTGLCPDSSLLQFSSDVVRPYDLSRPDR